MHRSMEDMPHVHTGIYVLAKLPQIAAVTLSSTVESDVALPSDLLALGWLGSHSIRRGLLMLASGTG